MTDIELRELVAGLATRQTETGHRLDRVERVLEDVVGDLAETARLHKESAQWQQQASQQLKENAQQLKENAQQLKENAQQLEENAREIKELGRQIGGLGQKFGGFTEGMAFPSMKKILEERFGMSVVSPHVSGRQNGRRMEIDVLAYSNSTVNEVYVVEVKSHLRDDGVDQILRILREFHHFFPVHEGKNVYGILAAVSIADSDVRERVLREGIYRACIHDDNFQLAVPEGFQPRAF